MTRSRRALKLVAETTREVGLLWTAFAPLEAFLAEKLPTPAKVWAFTGFGLTFIVAGIIPALEVEE